jgi:hypothetical protein
MNREVLNEALLALVLLAIPVLPVALWQMPVGSLPMRLLAAGALLAAAWVLMLGVIRVLTSRAIVGAVALALGLLLLFGCNAAGLFDAVGLWGGPQPMWEYMGRPGTGSSARRIVPVADSVMNTDVLPGPP